MIVLFNYCLRYAWRIHVLPDTTLTRMVHQKLRQSMTQAYVSELTHRVQHPLLTVRSMAFIKKKIHMSPDGNWKETFPEYNCPSWASDKHDSVVNQTIWPRRFPQTRCTPPPGNKGQLQGSRDDRYYPLLLPLKRKPIHAWFVSEKPCKTEDGFLRVGPYR